MYVDGSLRNVYQVLADTGDLSALTTAYVLALASLLIWNCDVLHQTGLSKTMGLVYGFELPFIDSVCSIATFHILSQCCQQLTRIQSGH